MNCKMNAMEQINSQTTISSMNAKKITENHPNCRNRNKKKTAGKYNDKKKLIALISIGDLREKRKHKLKVYKFF